MLPGRFAVVPRRSYGALSVFPSLAARFLSSPNCRTEKFAASFGSDVFEKLCVYDWATPLLKLSMLPKR